MKKLNRYTCNTCAKSIVTEDVDQGTTPFTIHCAATPGCPGGMQSAFYRVSQDNVATHVWRKPTKEEYMAASPAMKEHFDAGGLEMHAK